MARKAKPLGVKLAGLYAALATAAKQDLTSKRTRDALKAIIAESHVQVGNATSSGLTSNVPGKTYRMITLGIRTSRPVNDALFDLTVPIQRIFDAADGNVPAMPILDKALYTAGMSYAIAADITKDGDKKSPGTFFEIFVGHLVASVYKTIPDRSVNVPTLGATVSIPTDYVFALPNHRRLHLPVKMSTRERVIQVWAHQKMLDGMLGVGTFKGMLVCATETNKQQNVSVVEVCLPLQWAAYQMYIARLERIYYLDPPDKYIALRQTPPFIQVWPFSKFFTEAQQIII